MNDLTNTSGLLFPLITLVAIVCGLIIWFFVNRASVRANEQVRLLQLLVEEQKKQNALLKKLLPPASNHQLADDVERDFIRVIPER